MLTHPENFKSSHIYSIKKKLHNNYETLWKLNLNKCKKLRTYRKFKFIFRTKLIFLILELLAIETFLHAFVLVTTSSILKRVDIPVQLLLLKTVYVPIVTLKA